MILVVAVTAIAVLAAFEAAAGMRLLTAAALAAVTVLAFDLGMGGWMLLLHFTENMPLATDIAFWFLMQFGVVLGTLTALPVVRWLGGRRPSPYSRSRVPRRTSAGPFLDTASNDRSEDVQRSPGSRMSV